MEALLSELFGFFDDGTLTDLLLSGHGFELMLFLEELGLSGFLMTATVGVHI